MREETIFNYSGELIFEMQEANKLNDGERNKKELQQKPTSTFGCGSWLTIICC